MTTRGESLSELNGLLDKSCCANANNAKTSEEKIWQVVADLAEQATLQPRYLADTFAEHRVYISIACHWIFFCANAPRLLQSLVAGKSPCLWRQEVDGRWHDIVLDLESYSPAEGELSLLYRVNEVPFYLLSFVVAPGDQFDLGCPEVLFVTRMQRQFCQFEDIRRATRDLDDITPQTLLFTVARACAAAFDLSRIVAVRGCDQLSFVLSRLPVFENQYDNFLLSIGAELLPAGYFSLESAVDGQNRRTQNSKHVARAARKRRVKAAIFDEVVHRLRADFVGLFANGVEGSQIGRRLIARERAARRQARLRVMRGLRVLSKTLNNQAGTHPLRWLFGAKGQPRPAFPDFRHFMKVDDIYRPRESRSRLMERLITSLSQKSLDRSYDEFCFALRKAERDAGVVDALRNGTLTRNEQIDILQNNMFDPDYYLFSNPDVKSAGYGAVAHYVDYGAKEGRNPNSYFSTKLYCLENPDVAQSGLNPLLHFVLVGASEGRRGVHRIERATATVGKTAIP